MIQIQDILVNMLLQTLSDGTPYLILNDNDMDVDFHQLNAMEILIKSFGDDIENIKYGRGFELFETANYTPMFSFELKNLNRHKFSVDYYKNVRDLIITPYNDNRIYVIYNGENQIPGIQDVDLV